MRRAAAVVLAALAVAVLVRSSPSRPTPPVAAPWPLCLGFARLPHSAHDATVAVLPVAALGTADHRAYIKVHWCGAVPPDDREVGITNRHSSDSAGTISVVGRLPLSIANFLLRKLCIFCLT
jgi:hypothetical protein